MGKIRWWERGRLRRSGWADEDIDDLSAVVDLRSLRRGQRRLLLQALAAGTVDQPLEWLRLGVDLRTAPAWVEVGLPEITGGWRSATGVLEEARKWADEGFGPAEARGWVEAFRPADARCWYDAGIPSSEALRFRDMGVEPADARLVAGITAAALRRWVESGFDDWEEAARWRSRVKGSPELCAVWRAAGFTPDDTAQWLQATDDPTAARAAVEAGLSAPDVARWDLRARDTVSDALEYWRVGIPMRMTDPHWYGRYASLGLTAAGASDAMTAGLNIRPLTSRTPFPLVEVECDRCRREARSGFGREFWLRSEHRSVSLCAECIEVEEMLHGEDFWRRG